MIERQHHIPSKIIFIRGDIFLNHKIPKKLMDLGCCFNESEIKNIHQVIEGDFIIDDDTETYEDACYYASGNVSAFILTGELISRFNLVESYDKAIDDIIILSRLEIDDFSERLLLKMLFANVYSSMEAFLQDSFIFYLTREQKNKEASLKLQDSKLPKSVVITEEINPRSVSKIKNFVFHRLSKEICPLFEKTFGISFPDYQYIEKNLMIRHDIVHRNGCSKDKLNVHIISKQQLYELIEEVDKFVHALFVHIPD